MITQVVSQRAYTWLHYTAGKQFNTSRTAENEYRTIIFTKKKDHINSNLVAVRGPCKVHLAYIYGAVTQSFHACAKASCFNMQWKAGLEPEGAGVGFGSMECEDVTEAASCPWRYCVGTPKSGPPF